jgi:hypothetical protein
MIPRRLPLSHGNLDALASQQLRTPLDAAVLDRNAAITAMVLADATGSGDIHPGHRLWVHVEGWATELGLTAPDILTMTTRAPNRTDAGKNALLSDPEAAG